MPVHHQIGKSVDGNILRRVNIMHKAVYKKYQPVKQLPHDVLKGTLLSVKEAAIAAGAGIHVLPSFG